MYFRRTLLSAATRLGLAGLIACPAPSMGQTVVTGQVMASGRALAGAEVNVDPGAQIAFTGDSGRYRLLVPAPGITRISVRAVGFYPATRRFVLAGADTVVADFVLAPVPQRLDSIAVTGNPAPVSGKMLGFEARRQMGFGRFFTREFLAQRETSTLANVLRLAVNLQLVRRPARCGGGFSAATGRSGAVPWETWMACAGSRFTPACYAPIYLDGVSYWGPGLPGVPPPDVEQLNVIDLEGIEVYRGMSEAPLQYRAFGSACGVVLLWTRIGGRRPS